MKIIHIISIIICIISVLGLMGCDLFGGDGSEEGRPPIPEPDSYIGSVPMKSEELIVATDDLLEFSPVVDIAKDENGNNILQDHNNAIDLVSNGVVILHPTTGTVDTQPLENVPQLQLVRYWQRVGTVSRYPGGTVTSVTRSVSRGYTTSELYSFTETIGASASAGVGFGGFGSATVTVSTEFSATQTLETEYSETVSTEETYEVTPEDNNLVICVWQLVEEWRIVHPDPVDGEYVTFYDDNYEFTVTEENPQPFVFVLQTDAVYPKSTAFAN